MKVIFLDNDGVICLYNNFGSRFKKRPSKGESKDNVKFKFDNFDKKAIKVLNEILEETGAEIVVSSDWQNFATLEELQEYYKSQGIIKEPISCTKVYGIDSRDHDNFPWEFRKEYEQTRSLEILNWLKKNKVDKWVAIDDLYMAKDNNWGLTNFVWTPLDTEGIKQTGIKEKILSFLR